MGLVLLVPDLVELGLPEPVRRAGYPGTRVVPAVSWLLSLLALKLTRTRRVSHVDDLLLADPAASLFAIPAATLNANKPSRAAPAISAIASAISSGRSGNTTASAVSARRATGTVFIGGP